MKKTVSILALSGMLFSTAVQAMDPFQQNGRCVDEGAARRFVPGPQLQQPAQPVQPHIFQQPAHLGGWGTTQQPIATTGVQSAYSAPQASPFGYGQQPTAQAAPVQPHIFQPPMQPFAQQPVQSTWGAPMQQVSAAVQPSVGDEERERFIKRVEILDKDVRKFGGYGIHAKNLTSQETLRHKESVKRTFDQFKQKSAELMALFEEGKKKNYFRENGLKSVEKATARINKHKAHYKAYGANLRQAILALQQAEALTVQLSVLELIDDQIVTREEAGDSLKGEAIMFLNSGPFPQARSQLIAASNELLKGMDGFKDLAIQNISMRLNASDAEKRAQFPNTHAQVVGWLQSKQDRYAHLQGYCRKGLDSFIDLFSKEAPAYKNMFHALALLQRVEQKVNPSEAFDTLLTQAFGFIEDQLNPEKIYFGLNCGTAMNCRAFLLRAAIMKFLKDQGKLG